MDGVVHVKIVVCVDVVNHAYVVNHVDVVHMDIVVHAYIVNHVDVVVDEDV